MNKKILLAVIAISSMVACSSTPKQATAENTADVVVSRIDDLSKRPEWVRESEAFKVKDGTVYSLGATTIPGDHRVEAAYRVAENNAKAAIAGAIEQRLEFVFQNAEEGTTMDTTQARYIGAEASNLVASSIRPGQRYWEKVATTKDSGERVTQYKVFTLVSMPEADFKQSIMDAIRKKQGKGGLSADFAKKVDKQWDRFVDGARAPSNQE